MAAHMDQRVVKTRQKLFYAYLQLLKRKTSTDITIQALTQEAGVNRVTFYKHFGHIANFHAAFIEHYMLELYAFMKPLNYKAYSKGFEYEALLQLLIHIKANEDTYNVLLASPYIGEFNQQLLSFLQQKITLHTSELAKLEFPGTGVDQRIVAWYGVSALLGTIVMWVQSGFPYTPQQLADSFIRLSPHTEG